MLGTSNKASVPAEGFPAVWARLNSPASVLRGQSQRMSGRDRAGERGWRELWRWWFEACGWERWGQQTWCWTTLALPSPGSSSWHVCSESAEPKSASPGTSKVNHRAINIFPAPPISCLTWLPPFHQRSQQQVRPSKRILQRQSWGREWPWKQTRVTVLLNAAGLRLSKLPDR